MNKGLYIFVKNRRNHLVHKEDLRNKLEFVFIFRTLVVYLGKKLVA